MVSHGGCTPQNEDGAPKGSNGSSSSSLGTGGSGAGKHHPPLKKGPWTAAEDAILMEYVKKNGEGNWNAVQKNTSLARCGKSCRLRWTNHLRPNLKKGSFTPEEERLILQLHAQLGNKWARMAAQLPGRTDNEIKNYWNTRIKRRIRQGLPLYPHDVSQQNPPASPPAPVVPSQPPEPHSNPDVPAASGFRHRPHIQIPTRNFSTALGQSQSRSPSPLSLSPHSYHHLKSSFDSSLSLFDSSTSLPHPTSTFTTSPLLYKQYIDPNLNLNPFPLQFPVTSSHGSPLPSTVMSTTHLPNVNSFQFNPLNFNMNSAQSLQTQFEQERLLSPCPVYGIGKPEQELPSNQLYLFQTEKHETETTLKSDAPQSNSGLLEDLLKEAETFAAPEDLRRHSLLNLQEEKFDFSLNSSCGWDATGSDNTAAGIRLKAEAKDQIESMTMHEDLSKLLNSIPSSSSSHMPEPYNSNLLENPSSQSPGYASGITDDSIGLEIQHIASLLQTDSTEEHSREPGSCSWNNLPRIC